MNDLEVITCRIDKESKDKIQATKIKESRFIRMTIKQVLKEKNSALTGILYQYEINNEKIRNLEKLSEIIREQMKEYQRNTKKMDEVDKPINSDFDELKIMKECKNNIRNIQSRGIEVTLDMLQYNAGKAGLNVNRFIEILIEEGILPENAMF